MPTSFASQQPPQQPGRAGSTRLPNGKIGTVLEPKTKISRLIWRLHAKQTIRAGGLSVEMCPWVVVLPVIFQIPQGSWGATSVLHRVWARNQQRRWTSRRYFVSSCCCYFVLFFYYLRRLATLRPSNQCAHATLPHTHTHTTPSSRCFSSLDRYCRLHFTSLHA